tara:strand:- start:582 stop:740 length:159 start_codon:yes stop_codon:yes gene_type:complete
MRWPTLIVCSAEVREAPDGPGVLKVCLRFIGYVGSISVAGPTMDAAREHRRG